MGRLGRVSESGQLLLVNVGRWGEPHAFGQVDYHYLLCFLHGKVFDIF